nr:hypothetical protein [Tanacetum cinerariifolium]
SPKEPTRKSKRVKRPAKKSSDAPTVGVVIRETHVKSLSKKKEKITVEKRKGIDFLSEGALTEEAVTTLEKEVAKLKRNDALNSQVTDLVDEHLDSRLGATRDEFISYLSASITTRIIEQVKSQLPPILPNEVSNFAPLLIKSIITEGTKSQSKSSGKSVQSEEPEFEVVESNMPQDQEENPDFSAYIMNGLKITNLTQETLLRPAHKLLKGTHSNYAELKYDFKECYKALSEKLDWNNLEGGDYPFYLTKPLPLVMNGNRQMVPVDYFFNNDLKYLQGGILTMTYTTSLAKTKAA